jgi:hypothetical protein
VAHARDRQEFTTSYAGGGVPASFERHQRIIGAMDHQGWSRDALQLFATATRPPPFWQSS